MKLTVIKFLIMVGLVGWMFVCIQLYRTSRGAAWLAAPTVASCLFLSGATAAASVFVRGALWLTPLWLGVVGLAVLHLWAARRSARGHRVGRSRPQQSSASPAPVAARELDTDVLI